MPLTCVLDLDGVLTDFDRAMKAHHGYDWRVPDKQQPWSSDWTGLSATEWWAPASSQDFWEKLHWTDEGQEIVLLAETLFGVENVAVVTSPGLSPYSAAGKMAWIQAELPELSRQFFIGSAKHLLARPNVVLLDDYDKNVHDFKALGGKAVTVPRQWNHLYPLSHGKTMSYVSAALRYAHAGMEAEAGQAA